MKDEVFKGSIRVYGIGGFSATDPLKQLRESRGAVMEVIDRELRLMKGMKFYKSMRVRFVRESADGSTEEEAHFNSKAVVVIHEVDTWEAVESSVPDIILKVEKWTRADSWWAVDEILRHDINILKYTPLRSGRHMSLPVKLSNSMKELYELYT